MSETSVNLGRSHRYKEKFLILTVLPKTVITKLKFLKETHTVTKISEDSEIASYIFFLINNKIKNKQPPNSNCLHSISHFNSLPQLLTKSLNIFRKNSLLNKKRQQLLKNNHCRFHISCQRKIIQEYTCSSTSGKTGISISAKA